MEIRVMGYVDLGGNQGKLVLDGIPWDCVMGTYQYASPLDMLDVDTFGVVMARQFFDLNHSATYPAIQSLAVEAVVAAAVVLVRISFGFPLQFGQDDVQLEKLEESVPA